MLKEFLMRAGIKSQAKYVEMGYGQVEPNHLSAQRNAQIYAQLPADPSIEVLEQGQFVKYDYAAGLVNFTGAGEWMLVYNEIKLYREHQLDCEFAMVKGNYQARVYSPLDGDNSKEAEELYGPTRFLQGRREKWDGEKFVPGSVLDKNGAVVEPVVGENGKVTYPGVDDFSVASEVHDYYEMNDINNPEIKDDYRTRLFMKLRAVKHPEKMMPAGTTMVPRVFKTMPGDIFTTNMIDETELAVRDELTPNAKGILAKVPEGATPDMVWQVVKVYTMPDFQRGVKIMRIK
jgi:hypothetical protein